MKFKKNNRISYHQDFHKYRCLPSGVDFHVERFGEGWKLTGYGYGQLHPRDNGSYGNGSIYVYKLTQRQAREFAEAAKEKP